MILAAGLAVVCKDIFAYVIAISGMYSCVSVDVKLHMT